VEWGSDTALRSFTEERTAEFERITADRRKELENLAADLRIRLEREHGAELIFICSHNSRRSQMAQLWARLSAQYYGIEGLRFYSGGTGATAFHPNAVEAMNRAGFRIRVETPGPNPVYRVRFPEEGEEKVYSKRFDDPLNPAEGFIVVMTCSEADEACPFVPGSSARYAIQYEDPGSSDGTPGEQEAYAARCRQIAREMLCLFSLV
jgi:arsenate reductase